MNTVTKTFRVDRNTGNVSYRHAVEIGGRQFFAEETVPGIDSFRHAPMPVPYIDERLRRSLMHEIESTIYSETR